MDEYRMIADQIAAEMKGGKDPSKKKPRGIEDIEAAMREEEPEGEGGDAWLTERTQKLIDEYGDEFYNMNAEELSMVADIMLSPEEAALYDQADPVMRKAVIEQIQSSAGMGDVMQLMNKGK